MTELSGHITLALNNTLNLDRRLGSKELKDYQFFTARVFLGLKTFRKLLLFWDTGAGKTLETIYILKHINVVYPTWHVFLFIKASLSVDPWGYNINQHLENENHLKITIINYDDPNSYLIFQKKLREINLKSTRLFFVIDEVHNFISRSLPVMNKKRYTNYIYKLLVTLLHNSDNRLLAITATPIINEVSEFNMLCGLLRNNMNINNDMFHNYKLLCKDEVIEILGGISSYHRFNESDTLKDSIRSEYFPEKKIIFLNTQMSDYQSDIYMEAAKLERKTNARGFRIFRRLTSTFVYQGLKTRENMSYEEYELNIKSRLADFVMQYAEFRFSDEFINKFKELDDITYISSNIHEDTMFNTLRSFSCKYIEACKIILQSRGKCLVYEPFVSFEGVMSFKIYLRCFGIKFIEYTKNSNNRTFDVGRFNHADNIDGDLIKVCIFSGAGTEGISFFGINDLVILDIPWSDASLRQIIGRGIRLYSHSMLPVDRQYINVFIVISHAKSLNSVDKEMLSILIRKNRELSELYDLLKKVSLEYTYSNYAPDIIENEYIFNKLEDRELKNVNKVNLVKRKLLTPIFYTSDNYVTIQTGYLDKDTNFVYSNDSTFVGEIDLLKFDIIDKQIIYPLIDKRFFIKSVIKSDMTL